MAIRTLLVVVLAVSTLLTSVGCGSAAGTSSSDETVSSDVLRAEFGRVFAEMTARVGSGDPGRTKLANSRIITELTTQAPGMFQVSPKDEARFERDGFDDAANGARVIAAEKVTKAKGGAPRLTQYLLEQHRSKPLTGVRLELLAHLAERNAKFLSDGGGEGAGGAKG